MYSYLVGYSLCSLIPDRSIKQHCVTFFLFSGVGYIMFPLADFCGGQLYQVGVKWTLRIERKKKIKKERKEERKKEKRKKERTNEKRKKERKKEIKRSLLVTGVHVFLTGFKSFFFTANHCMYHCAKCVHMYLHTIDCSVVLGTSHNKYLKIAVNFYYKLGY